MTENKYSFEMPSHHKSIIKVIGVGGGGSNAVTHMYNQGIRDVEFYVCNTDAQAIKGSAVPNKLQIGVNLTEGLGAGANPEKGKNAAIESKEEIRDLLSKDTKMVFITAGMGGGTGTGAAPEIARVAKELGVLTVGIVTLPFNFEGRKKQKQAQKGIDELKSNCDTVIVILNDKLREIYGNLPISEAFAQADNILTTAAKGIAEIITVPGHVNVDFEDVKTVMKDSGAAVMGSAQTEGENRALRAAEEAISSPLLDSRNILGAQKILLSIISGEQAELQMDELTEITEFIQDKAGDDAEVIFGHGIDPELGNCIRVTVIATGFNLDESQLFQEEKKRIIDLNSNKQLNLYEQENSNPTNSKSDEARQDSGRNYSFDQPGVSPKKEEQEAGSYLDLGDEYEFIDNGSQGVEAKSQHDEADDQDDSLADKRHTLMEKAKERVRKLKGLKTPGGNSNDDDFRDRLDTPAYLRKKVRLQDVPHSSEKNISRYNLNDDNQILGNNRFLHDNVD